MEYLFLYQFFLPVRLLGVIGLLVFAVLFARHRATKALPGDQTRRILFAGLTFMLGSALGLGLLLMLLSPAAILGFLILIAIWIGTPALISIALVDVGAWAAEAERTAFWLGAGIVAYVALTFIWIGLVFGGIEPPLLPTLWIELLLIALVPVSAALIWWSYLPGESGGGGIAETFE